MRKIILQRNNTSNREMVGITNTKIKKQNSFFKVSKTKITIATLLVTVLVLEGVNIFLSNSTATDSIEASILKKELAVVTQENNVVRAKVYELSSYESVASRAAEFGFAEAQGTISLDSPVQVALQ
jgi:cell division protein FtsL